MVTKEILGRDLTAKDHVLIAATWDPPTAWMERIRNEHPGIRVTYYHIKMDRQKVFMTGGKHVPDELFADVTIFVTMNYLPEPAIAPKLEIVSILSAGVDRLDHTPLWRDTDITITAANGVHGPQIAEWIMGHLLAHTHHFRLLEQWQRDHHWGNKGGSYTGRPVRDLVGQKIGIYSYGSIGRQCGRVAHALGMEVHAYTASPRPTPESRRDNGYIVPGTGDAAGEFPVKWYSGMDRGSLREFLAVGFDVLVLAVPLTAETRGLLGREEFEVIRRSGRNMFLVNVSRGPLVVTGEMERMLRLPLEEGGLRGAALDVVDPEPLPEDHPLWDVPNVYISPHVSGSGETYFERCLDILAINLQLRAEGKRLINVVDRKRGY
ncbi:hypothetical protein TWF696_001987 [Orbilia brochopaga]|uniref:D-isomer specific 2-hydroxyacid dehydrogenase NAD-binding domain-containing protein n=1 Tax=Orbilia brochopaga TaxID=3140254 RepID=A0AAV9U6H6_9PEZI